MVKELIEQECSQEADDAVRARLGRSPLRTAAAALFVCFSCVPLLPHTAKANQKSEFPNPLCSPNDPNCICPGGPGSNFCILQPRLNNPLYVHFKLLGDWEFVNLRGQGNQQIEVKPGETTYVNRSKDGPTSFGVQFCQKTLTGSDCSTWATMTLQEPTTGQLAQCQDYADKAIAAVNQNKKLGCGFNGPRWSSDSKAHYNACAGNFALLSETAAREQQLQDCKAKIAANAAEVAKTFTGNWAVSMPPVGDFTFVLTQQGPAVNGQMVNADPTKNGTIQGSLEADNQHVSFSYVQPQSNAGGQGRFWMEVTKDKLGGRFFVNGEQAVRLLDGTRK